MNNNQTTQFPIHEQFRKGMTDYFFTGQFDGELDARKALMAEFDDLQARLKHASQLVEVMRTISIYETPEELEEISEEQYGLEPEEAIRYAYENIINSAKQALANFQANKEQTDD